MIVTAISGLVGFLSSMFPELLRLFQDRADRRHELAILRLQLESRRQGESERLEEVRVQAGAQASRALYKTYYSGIRWVDALAGTVRPMLAYGFFLLYATVKLVQLSLLAGPWQMPALGLWQEEDQALFAAVVSFYFGQRAMSKLRS